MLDLGSPSGATPQNTAGIWSGPKKQIPRTGFWNWNTHHPDGNKDSIAEVSGGADIH